MKRVLWNSLISLTLLRGQAARGAEPLSGAGATFPFPLYQKWISTFEKKFPGIQIAYKPIGSGAGIAELAAKRIDFAASEFPLTDRELASFPVRVRHIPTVVGGVVIIYRLDGLVQDLRLTPDTLAGIYLGKIRRWNDPRLRSINRGLPLPDREITTVHRSDSSGTTFILTSYLSQVNAEWKSAVGAGAVVPWPTGKAGEFSDGVAKQVAATPDSIGYVEFFYALENRVSYALLRNSAGQFVQADLTSLPAAAESLLAGMPDDLRLSLVNAPGKASYPLASLTYLLVPEKFENEEKAKAMAEFLRWLLDTGQKQAGALGYVALPARITEKAVKLVGKPN